MKFCKIIVFFLSVILLFGSAFPVFAEEMTEKYVVCLDPGHGGIDGGTDAGLKTEKEYDLAIALYLRDALLANGRFDVVMTRDDDSYLKYAPRADIARQANADVLISLHCNQVKEDYVNGSQAFVSLIPEYSAATLAGALLDSIDASVGIKRGRVETRSDTGDSLGVYYWDSSRQWDMPGAYDLGQVSDYFSINTFSSKFGIPSIIIEHGYLSNEHDLAILNDDIKLKEMAEAEADAIIAFFTGHDHDFVLSVDYPSNCTLVGKASSRCTVCGAKKDTVDLPPSPNAHFWRLSSTDADGTLHYICQIEYNLSAKGFDLGHDVSEKTESSASGITPPETTEDIPCEHYYTDESVQPTCTEDGRTSHRCLICGDDTVTVLPALGHDPEVISHTDPTCVSDGETVTVCSRCGEEFTEVFPATGHTYEHKPTGDVCSVCGERKSPSPFSFLAENPIITAAGLLLIVIIIVLAIVLSKKGSRSRKKHPLEYEYEKQSDRSIK